MKKEIFAFLTIVLLAALSAINVLYLKNMTNSMNERLSAASTACRSEDFQTAHSELSSALQTWLDADHYTHVFIRHSEIDSTTDAFYDALEAIRCKDSLAASAALEKLNYHLTSILTMEYVTVRSIF